jgi:hypothetical protein
MQAPFSLTDPNPAVAPTDIPTMPPANRNHFRSNTTPRMCFWKIPLYAFVPSGATSVSVGGPRMLFGSLCRPRLRHLKKTAPPPFEGRPQRPPTAPSTTRDASFISADPGAMGQTPDEPSSFRNGWSLHARSRIAKNGPTFLKSMSLISAAMSIMSFCNPRWVSTARAPSHRVPEPTPAQDISG